MSNTSTTPSAAILYARDGYDTQGARLLGRKAAGEGFLRGLVRHGKRSPIVCLARSRPEFSDFCRLVQPWIVGQREFRWADASSPEALATLGTLYRPDAVITEEAFRRRGIPGGSRAYSLCGVTHTIASRVVLGSIADMLIAPLEPWDALVCTSQAVRTAIERAHASFGAYLEQRTAGRATMPAMLPVIPLGVDCDSCPPIDRAAEARTKLRQALGAEPDDFVCLFLGRLIFYAKAHPAPMYMALDRVAAKTGQKVHLIQAGWFENPQEEADFHASAATLAPRVRAHFVDGRKPEVRQSIWQAADVFVSLADNVQETFGMAPVEAMAHGLPVVVSDWNGYKESVRDGVDGFRIPVAIPEAGAAADLSSEYLVDALSYSDYVAHTSMATTVDVDACTKALLALAQDPDLRQKMGENGLRRAREVYDWRVIIAAYEDLWDELDERRFCAPATSPPLDATEPAVPMLDDPFRQFAHYATTTLSSDSRLTLGSMAAPQGQRALAGLFSFRYGANRRATGDAILRIIALLEAPAPRTVAELAASLPDVPRPVLLRTLGHLAKFDVLKIVGP